MTDAEPQRSGAGRTLADVAHTHPHTGRAFGTHVVFARGRALAADGGRPVAGPERELDGPETLATVDHTPPDDSEGANPVFERGGLDRRERGSVD